MPIVLFVKIISSPISKRYVKSGDFGTIVGSEIRVNGVYFPFNEKWEVVEITQKEYYK